VTRCNRLTDLPVLLRPWDGPLGAPPFAQVRPEDFPSAFDTAMAWHRAEIAAIADQSAAPDFDNTIAALERSGEALARVRRLFWTLSSTQATPDIRAIEGDIAARLSAHSTKIGHDDRLAARIAAAHAGRYDAGLNDAQIRLVETTHAGFLRSRSRPCRWTGRTSARSVRPRTAYI